MPHAKGAMTPHTVRPRMPSTMAVTALGFAGYALWRLCQAVLDTEDKGEKPQGVLTRLGYAGSGAVYAGLALYALQLLRGAGGGASGDRLMQDWTARLLAQPLGAWLVAAVGVGFVGGGLYQLYRAYSGEFREKLDLAAMSGTVRTWATRFGRFGFAARGVGFVVIGLFAWIVMRAFFAGRGRPGSPC